MTYVALVGVAVMSLVSILVLVATLSRKEHLRDAVVSGFLTFLAGITIFGFLWVFFLGVRSLVNS